MSYFIQGEVLLIDLFDHTGFEGAPSQSPHAFENSIRAGTYMENQALLKAECPNGYAMVSIGGQQDLNHHLANFNLECRNIVPRNK